MKTTESQLATRPLISVDDPRWPIARALLHASEYNIVNDNVYFLGPLADLNALITLVNTEYDNQIQSAYERRNKYT